MNEAQIKIFSSVEELNAYARSEIARIGAESIEKRGVFTIALSGGSTPKKLYSMLAAKDFQGQIDWQKTQFFFGDERLVAPDSEESNFRMANETLFSKIQVPPQNIHRFHTEKIAGLFEEDYPGCGFGWINAVEKEAREIAGNMETDIRRLFSLKKDFPRFDLILLGMGADGHTASLFPETDALQEKEKIAVENFVSKFGAFRLTFTFPTINNAQNILFLIAGADKADALREVLQGEHNPDKFPSQFIKPENGKLLFLLDKESAKFIDKG